MAIPGSGSACTGSCAMPVAWDSQRGTAVRLEAVALGYADGSAELLFNFHDGAPCVRVQVNAAQMRLHALVVCTCMHRGSPKSRPQKQ